MFVVESKCIFVQYEGQDVIEKYVIPKVRFCLIRSLRDILVKHLSEV